MHGLIFKDSLYLLILTPFFFIIVHAYAAGAFYYMHDLQLYKSFVYFRQSIIIVFVLLCKQQIETIDIDKRYSADDKNSQLHVSVYINVDDIKIIG